MTMNDYLIKAIPTAIDYDNGIPYIEPLYRRILIDAYGEPPEGWEEVDLAIRLTLEKFDRVHNKQNEINEWVYNLILANQYAEDMANNEKLNEET